VEMKTGCFFDKFSLPGVSEIGVLFYEIVNLFEKVFWQLYCFMFQFNHPVINHLFYYGS